MKTKFYLPQNIFSRIFLSEIKDKSNLEIEFVHASLIAKNISNEQQSIGLIPTMDLISNKDLFISSAVGISFDALLSNAYIHFKEEQETIDELFMKGDISSNEVILSKILFKEFYDVDIKTTLMSSEVADFSENLLIVGDDNYDKELFLKGLSFSEEIIELINGPYVNFVLAGSDEGVIKVFEKTYKDNFSGKHLDNIRDLQPSFPTSAHDFISVNIQHLVFDFDEQDIEGIKLLLQMPYYHGLMKEMIDVKFA